MNNLSTDFLLHEQISTTLPKAKALRPYVEKIITRSRDDSLHNRREVARKIKRADVLQKLFEVIGPRYLNRNGGYTRIVKAGFRRGDSAPMAVIELVDRDLDAKGTRAYLSLRRNGVKDDDADED